MLRESGTEVDQAPKRPPRRRLRQNWASGSAESVCAGIDSRHFPKGSSQRKKLVSLGWSAVNWLLVLLAWVVSLGAAIWIIMLGPRDSVTQARPGLRERLIERLPAAGLAVASLCFGVWACLAAMSQEGDLTLGWAALGIAVASAVAGLWFTVSPWVSDSE